MITQRRQTITITMSLIRDKRRTNAIKSYRKKEQWANVCKSCGFRFIHGFYVSVSIQKYLKGSLQPKLKGASVWPFNTHSKVPTGWICHKGKLQRLYNDGSSAGFFKSAWPSGLSQFPGEAQSGKLSGKLSKIGMSYSVIDGLVVSLSVDAKLATRRRACALIFYRMTLLCR